MSDSTALAVHQPRTSGGPISIFANESAFEAGQRMCGALVTSNLVPVEYRGKENMGNALIALDMANRMGIPAIMVMQNLDVIEGRPSWKSQFIIGALNSCGLFSPIRFRVEDRGEREVSYLRWSGPKGNRTQQTVTMKVHDQECVAYAVEKGTGEVLEGPPVSIEMAVKEGWYNRFGSKWQTMPELMLRYRAAAFFGRLYAPHILNGMPMADEVIDVEYEVVKREEPAAEADGADSDKPASRPSGVHAAMNRAKQADAGSGEDKADKGKGKGKAKAKEEPAKAEPSDDPAHDPETGELEEAEVEVIDSGGGDGDMFGSPDEDDDGYNPA